MGFKATEWVQPLDYDFRPMFDYAGTITEPSDAAISKFLRKWYRLIAEMRKVATAAVVEAARTDAAEEAAQKEATDGPEEPVDTETAIAEMMAIDWNAIEDETNLQPQTIAARETLKQMCRLVEDLAGGSIRADKLQQVPMRLRGVFFGWLVGELTEQGKEKTGSSSI